MVRVALGDFAATEDLRSIDYEVITSYVNQFYDSIHKENFDLMTTNE